MRILVVDDSIVFRSAIRKALEQNFSPTGLSEDNDVLEVRVASNGRIALEIFKGEKHHFDAMVTDIEMPEMDGITLVEEIRKLDSDIPILVFSSTSPTSVMKTLGALSKGAQDFIQKGTDLKNIEDNIEYIRRELLSRLKGLVLKKRRPHPTIPIKLSRPQETLDLLAKPEFIVIASSTGGPDVLKRIFEGLEGPFKIPIFLVQHMPPIFTAKLAELLDRSSKITVLEAKEGQIVEDGTCYLAPGDFHMEIILESERKVISLNKKEKDCFVRPSANVTFFSLTKVLRKRATAFILTGMGEDGLAGVRELKPRGLDVIIQDEESSVVWGMPGAIAREKLENAILDIPGIILALNDLGRR